MKKILAGGIMLIVGAAIYLTIHIPAAKLASNLGGWSNALGRLGTALNVMGGTEPTNYSIFLMILGVILLLLGAFGDEIKFIIRIWKEKSLHEQTNKSKEDNNL
jgi:hypothetical protein